MPLWALKHAQTIGTKADSWAVIWLTLTGWGALSGLVLWESTNLTKQLNKTSEEVAETKMEVAEIRMGLRNLAADMKAGFKALHLASSSRK